MDLISLESLVQVPRKRASYLLDILTLEKNYASAVCISFPIFFPSASQL